MPGQHISFDLKAPSNHFSYLTQSVRRTVRVEGYFFLNCKYEVNLFRIVIRVSYIGSINNLPFSLEYVSLILCSDDRASYVSK
jgi:hypothetical protein